MLLSSFLFTNCKYIFLVKKENVIKNSHGFIFFTKDEIGNFISDYFIPTDKIGNSDDFLANFLLQKPNNGFRINMSKQDRHFLISNFSDTLYNQLYEKFHILTLNDNNRHEFGNIYILPVSIKYADIEARGSIENEAYSKLISKSFVLKNINVPIKYFKGKRIWLLNTYPVIDKSHGKRKD